MFRKILREINRRRGIIEESFGKIKTFLLIALSVFIASLIWSSIFSMFSLNEGIFYYLVIFFHTSLIFYVFIYNLASNRNKIDLSGVNLDGEEDIL